MKRSCRGSCCLLVCVEDEVVILSIDDGVFDQGPVPSLISPLDEPQDGSIIGVFDDDVDVLGGDGRARTG